MSEPTTPQPPPWAPTRDDPAPDGFRYAWQRHDGPDAGWQWLMDSTGRRCRQMRGDGPRLACGRPAVARLRRAYHRDGCATSYTWWHYCEMHLYGRVVHDGALWFVVLEPDEAAPPPPASTRPAPSASGGGAPPATTSRSTPGQPPATPAEATP